MFFGAIFQAKQARPVMAKRLPQAVPIRDLSLKLPTESNKKVYNSHKFQVV